MGNRRFMVQYREDGPIATAVWKTENLDISEQSVEDHCRRHQSVWQRNLYRLIELKPIKVEFKTIIDLVEA